MEDSASFDCEELEYEDDIREAYEEILDNISTIRETLQYFRRSKRNSLQGFELESLQKVRSLSLPTTFDNLRKERSLSCNDALSYNYEAVYSTIQSTSTPKVVQDKVKKTTDFEVMKADINNNNSNEKQFTAMCEISSNKDTTSRSRTSNKQSCKYLRRAFAALKSSENNNDHDNNNIDHQVVSSDFRSVNENISKFGNITFKTLKTKNDVLHVVKADV